ncbi:NAD(P)/FAD-dependent oxidoreductase [Oscillospiraceae bacterium PP1C4]
MSIIVNSITTSLSEDKSAAISKAISLLGISADAVKSSCIIKTSLDARKRTDTHFVHSVAITLDGGEDKVVERTANKQITLRVEQPLEVVYGLKPLQHRPVIIGFGPAGMFAGLLLARHGYRPIILERGSEIDRRIAAVEGFWANGTLDVNANVQFGEGGAGTFSDGKLTTRIGDSKCSWVLEQFVKFGAPSEILQKAKPHIGTDRLREIVKNMRREIISLGGEIRFDTALTDLKTDNGVLTAAVTAQGELAAEALILATGHSARDTFAMLHRQGFSMEAKPFSVGVRIEHLQAEIDRGLYGELAGHPSLPVGEYQLSHRLGERGVYTFCMCPGGFVVPSASQEGMVVTNGMSCYARDGVNANSAIAVSVTPDDYGKAPLDGMLFQQKLERFAYNAAGKSYKAPAQDVGHFLHGKQGLTIDRVKPSYSLGVEPCDFKEILPSYVIDMLKLGLMSFDRKIRGFSASDAILTGVETRTSSPVRVLRGEDLQSLTVRGVYPCAEGAGYAGGIISAAVDGIRTAQAIMAEYKA